MSPIESLAHILEVPEALLRDLDAEMERRTVKRGVLENVANLNDEHAKRIMAAIGASEPSANSLREALKVKIAAHEKQLRAALDKIPESNEFAKAAVLARTIAKVGNGFFLRREYAQEILRVRPPANLLAFLGLSSVEELFTKHDVTEAMSALRFIETDEWMHETFEKAYGNFTAGDFEERPIEIKVLGSEWHEVAAKFVAKKHHNVSHLKEFGVIFLNPIREDVSGKLLRDFALLLHYFHEIEFYSKLFRKYARHTNFAEKLKAFLRGDVKSVESVAPGEWLIVQRYLFKENPRDPRLFLPRVNPESLHWSRGERDLVALGVGSEVIDLELWADLDWVGSVVQGEVVSFDLEDNAMSAVSAAEGKSDHFNYHQREAMWTKLFSEYAGGEAAAENLLLENFDAGVISFS